MSVTGNDVCGVLGWFGFKLLRAACNSPPALLGFSRETCFSDTVNLRIRELMLMSRVPSCRCPGAAGGRRAGGSAGPSPHHSLPQRQNWADGSSIFRPGFSEDAFVRDWAWGEHEEGGGIRLARSLGSFGSSLGAIPSQTNVCQGGRSGQRGRLPGAGQPSRAVGRGSVVVVPVG